MKTSAVLKHRLHSAGTSHDVAASLQDAISALKVNWYRAAVTVMAISAVAMDFLFPPVKVAIGNGVDVYAGHADVPLSAAGAVHVDGRVLAVELAVILIAAIVGWRLGASNDGKRGRGKLDGH